MGIISHITIVLTTPSSTVHNTKYLDPYHWSHISSSCLFLRQWCRDVASGAGRHLDITFGLQLIESSSLVSVLFSEAFNHPYISFFHLLVTGFSVTCFCIIFVDPIPSFNWWAVSVGREELKWHQLPHYQLISQQGPHFIHAAQLKPRIKAQVSGKMMVYSEKTPLWINWWLWYEFIAINDSFWWAPEIDFHYETEARKVKVDFKSDLYR